MARHKEFDREEVLDRALMVFWAKGYRDTSMQDLVDAMGVNRGSLYDTFGGKRDLFLESLQRYRAEQAPEFLLGDCNCDDPLDQIRAIFEAAINPERTPEGCCGCFICTTAVEMAPGDEDMAVQVRAGLSTVSGVFTEMIKAAQKQGFIATDRDPVALASYLASNLNGLFVMMRSGTKPNVLKGIVEEILSSLRPS